MQKVWCGPKVAFFGLMAASPPPAAMWTYSVFGKLSALDLNLK